jgi:cytochrome P450
MRNPDVRRARLVLGDGLILSEGDFWKKQRRMMQPLFHKERIAAYGQRMVDLTEQALSSWRPGAVRDIHKDTQALTLKIVTDTVSADPVVPLPSLTLRPRHGLTMRVERRA